jgi:pimeloyl-ACP methyl ester carboxylesterase
MEWRNVEADGVRFAFLEEGSGPLVLLLHGFPDTAHTWDAVRPALAKAGYRAVSPNTRGYWPTSIPADGDYSRERLGKDIVALIGALGESQAIVIGHDWGAVASYAAANLAPEKVRFLVTVGIPHPRSLRPSPRLLWGGRHFFLFRRKSAIARLMKDDAREIDQLVRRWSPAWELPKDETRPVKEAFAHEGSAEAAVGYYRAMTLSTPRCLSSRIKVPSAVFSGTEDGVLVPADYERARICYTAPHTIVHMPGGHFLHREHPARFIEELLKLLPR